MRFAGLKGLRSEGIFGLVEVEILTAVLLKTSVARIRSKIIRMTFQMRLQFNSDYSAATE